MKAAIISAVVLGAATSSASADIFGSGENTFTIEFVPVGNAGNPDDHAGAGGGIDAAPYGGVSYSYRMGVHEISRNVMTKAVASGFAAGWESWGTGLQPHVGGSWFQAAAFVNWLNTSTGHHAAYQLDAGLTTVTLWSSEEAWQLGGENRFRHKDAHYFLPSEDEWYKAAYHQNDGVTANYWDFATASNSPPVKVPNGSAAGTAVYGQPFVPLTSAAVNDCGGLSAYGTMGQNGNLWEWLETAHDEVNDVSSETRVVRGGDRITGELYLRASSRLGNAPTDPTASDFIMGMRVASVSSPGPRLTNGQVTYPMSNTPHFSGTLVGATPLATATLQASADLGITDPWVDLATQPVNASGSATFSDVPDPGAAGSARNFYRVTIVGP